MKWKIGRYLLRWGMKLCDVPTDRAVIIFHRDWEGDELASWTADSLFDLSAIIPGECGAIIPPEHVTVYNEIVKYKIGSLEGD